MLIKKLKNPSQSLFYWLISYQERLEEWKNQQVEIFQLPPYSPQLNLIEILWRFMKYEWIELNAYESWDSLEGV